MKHGVCENFRRYYGEKSAFTLAEVLITLGIIGVVAALTMPSVINNHKKAVLHTQFKKAYAVIENFNLTMAANDINPYLEYGVNLSPRDESYQIKQTEDIAKILTNARVCVTSNQNKSCPTNINSYYKNLDKSANVHIDADSYRYRRIILSDGALLWVGGANYEKNRYYIDTNGIKKGPNRLGYDLFTFRINANGKITPDVNSGSINRCSFVQPAHGATYLGYGCAFYAAVDQNPDEPGKTYWKDFLK